MRTFVLTFTLLLGSAFALAQAATDTARVPAADSVQHQWVNG